MVFDCESSCLPPLPSGEYVIINKVNGNIKVIPSPGPSPSDQYPVVANAQSQIVCQFYLCPHY